MFESLLGVFGVILEGDEEVVVEKDPRYGCGGGTRANTQETIANSSTHSRSVHPTNNDGSEITNPTDSARSTSDVFCRGQSIPPVSSIRCTLHTKMPYDRKNTDLKRHYDILEVLGEGSIGTVSRVRKKREVIGGSARYGTMCSLTPQCSLNPVSMVMKSRSIHQLSQLSSTATATTSSSTGGGGTVTDDTSTLSGSRHNNASGGQQQRRSDGSYKPVYALKSIHLKQEDDMNYINELQNEIDILRSLDHPNIVKPMETFEYQKHLYLVMELCSGGDLYSRSPYTEQQAQKITHKLLSAVSYMHRCGFIHLDIKFENILFENESDNAEIKLVDMGLAKRYRDGDPNLTCCAGTIYSMAPEMLERSFTSQADLWSTGVVLFMLLSNKLPFFGETSEEVAENILRGKYTMDGPDWEMISGDAMHLVFALLQVDPNTRLNAPEALTHPWLSEDYFDSRTTTTTSNRNNQKSKNTTTVVEDSLDSVLMLNVRESLENFAGYSKLKKLGLMVVAHRSTTEEIGFLREAFCKYDVNGDGTISYYDFKAASAGYMYSDGELFKIFRGVDLDGSGFVHYTEFIAATLEAKGVIVEERLAEAFDRLDFDDTGAITKKNLKYVLEHGFEGKRLCNTLVTDMIADADFTKTGDISYPEFLILFDSRGEDAIRRMVKAQRPSLRRAISELSSSVHGLSNSVHSFGSSRSSRSRKKKAGRRKGSHSNDSSRLSNSLHSYDKLR